SNFDEAGLPEVELDGLDEHDSSRVLEVQGADLPADVKRRILDEALGNPLALIELPLAAKTSTLDGHSLPLTARLEQAFAAQVGGLDPAERQLLLVAALEDGESALLLRAAAAARGVPVDASAWGPLIAAGFGVLARDAFVFRHPLIRS